MIFHPLPALFSSDCCIIGRELQWCARCNDFSGQGYLSPFNKDDFASYGEGGAICLDATRGCAVGAKNDDVVRKRKICSRKESIGGCEATFEASSEITQVGGIREKKSKEAFSLA